MTKEQREKIEKHLTDLSKWDKHEVDLFARKWQNAKQSIDKEVWDAVQKGIDAVFEYFENRTNPMADEVRCYD